MRRAGARTVNADQIAEWMAAGYDSEVLLGRQAYMELEGLRKDVMKLTKHERVYPEVLPTQASLRWSTKSPNLGGFTREFWSQYHAIVLPDPGTFWIEFDWQGIEARMAIAYAGDAEDIEWLTTSDIHTETCKKYLFEWDHLPADWKGGKDERRTRAKNFRYGLTYGTDARAVLGMPGIETLGLDRTLLVRRAQRYLDARPRLVAWKAQVWEQCRVAKVARTFMGARRLLFGPAAVRMKDGLNHTIQGSVANMMNWSLVRISRDMPESYVVLNKHDGAILAFPDTTRDAVARCRPIVEREWAVGPGVTLPFPASWAMFTADGRRQDLA